MSSKNPLWPKAPLPTPEITFLVAPDVTHDPERLKVSPGIQLACQKTTGQDYAVDAYIPRLPFRPVGDTNVLELDPAGGCRRTRTVGILRLGHGLLQSLRKAAASFADPSDLRFYIDDLCAEMPPPWTVCEAPARLALGRNGPGLHTVTQDPVTGAYVGLHVDTFDQAYDSGRNNAGNRISVNIGTESRFFLFVPLAFRSLSAAGRLDTNTSVVTEFLRTNPTLPVVSLRVDPGEAYIAPTESMIHDASSFEMRSEDTHITGRGVFDPC